MGEPRKPARQQERPDLLRRRVSAVDDGDVRPDALTHLLFDELAKHGIVGATEDDGVDAGSGERLEIPADRESRDLPARPTLFGERHEQGRGMTDHLRARRQLRHGARIRARSDGARRGQDSDATRTSGRDRGPCSGLDDAENRNVELHAESLRCARAHGVAGDDQRLDPRPTMWREQASAYLTTVAGPLVP